MKKSRIPLFVVLSLGLLYSCQREADYNLHIGETLVIPLSEGYGNIWEWENQDEKGVITMTSHIHTISYTSEPVLNPDSITLCDKEFLVDYCFTAQKKGFVNVRMVYAKNREPEFQRRINFSTQVVE